VRGQVVSSEQGYLAFDDTVLDHNTSFQIELVADTSQLLRLLSVLDHNTSFQIELVRRQYSGNAHAVIKGIGVVTCVYINPASDQFWIINYRIYDPDRDGKTKLDHVREMLDNALTDKHLPFRGVLMDSWYAERKLMLHIERLKKVYYCPLKDNRQVDETGGEGGYQRVDRLTWTDVEQTQGKVVHLKTFPKGHQVKLFRLVLSSKRTDYVATNDMSQDSTHDTQQVCALRWKIEQFHRETKQCPGIEGCQCRLSRIQRNHIACAILVWVRLKQIAHETVSTIYALKQGLLDEYMRSQLRSPAIQMQFA
jgi:hypothetical protein